MKQLSTFMRSGSWESYALYLGAGERATFKKYEEPRADSLSKALLMEAVTKPAMPPEIFKNTCHLVGRLTGPHFHSFDAVYNPAIQFRAIGPFMTFVDSGIKLPGEGANHFKDFTKALVGWLKEGERASLIGQPFNFSAQERFLTKVSEGNLGWGHQTLAKFIVEYKLVERYQRLGAPESLIALATRLSS